MSKGALGCRPVEDFSPYTQRLREPTEADEDGLRRVSRCQDGDGGGVDDDEDNVADVVPAVSDEAPPPPPPG